MMQTEVDLAKLREYPNAVEAFEKGRTSIRRQFNKIRVSTLQRLTDMITIETSQEKIEMLTEDIQQALDRTKEECDLLERKCFNKIWKEAIKSRQEINNILDTAQTHQSKSLERIVKSR